MKNGNDPFVWDAYLHWAHILDTQTDGPFALEASTRPPASFQALSITGPAQPAEMPIKSYEPIFVRLKMGLTSEIKTALKLALCDKERPDINKVLEITKLTEFYSLSDENSDTQPFIIDPFELLIGIENAFKCDKPIEFFMYREHPKTVADHTKYQVYFDVIDVGPIALITGIDRAGEPFAPSAPKGGPKVIGAVIDNDIGFLNDAFTTMESGSKTSRFSGLWLQSRTHKEASSAPIGRKVLLGRELDEDAINALLKDYGAEEESAYRDINSQLQTWDPFQSAPLKHTHGTAVAALAYGNDVFAPDTDPTTVPLLGVQLPPEAAADTSGAYSESYIVQGVRWLCRKARHLSPTTTLVINISYGALAGPKDGSKFLEQQIKREIECAEEYGITVHVVYAWGNGRNNKQIARVKIAARENARAPKWIIPRGQRLPSFMEIREIGSKSDDDKGQTLKNVTEDLKFVLTSPSGKEKIMFNPMSGDTAAPTITPNDAGASARFYAIKDRDFKSDDRPVSTGMVQIAIAPTIPLISEPPIPVAEDGDWTLSIQNMADVGVELILQIQRGDTAPGFVIGGQQSQFEGEVTQDHSKMGARRDVKLPLTNEGTNSAYTTAQHSRIHTVGALQDQFGATIPTDYSAQGAPWTSVQEPSCAGFVVDKIFTTGLNVTGTYSGTRTRISGTSAAAALKSRALVKALL